MPRISPATLRHANNLSPFLPHLLQSCRSLASARNELQWLEEHVSKFSPSPKSASNNYHSNLLALCKQRAKGVPLQYLLGSQPFGELDILCRPGVLIPRPETEDSTSHLASLLLHEKWLQTTSTLRILDLCTGTGCIPLLLHALLSRKSHNLDILGVDISKAALRLADENLEHNIRQGHLHPSAAHQISFESGDIRSQSIDSYLNETSWDIVTSNPPYISEKGFLRETSRSVRNYEPKLALVPDGAGSSSSHPEDIFYPAIFRIASAVAAKLVFVEVSGSEQALRVAQYASSQDLWNQIEIWRDLPTQDENSAEHKQDLLLRGTRIKFKGSGHGRTVVCQKWR